MAYIYDLTDTWNAGGTTFNAIKMNVTDSASASASKLVTLQTNGAEHFSVSKAGVGYFSGNVGIGTSAPTARLDLGTPGNTTFLYATNGVDSTFGVSFASNATTITNLGGAAAIAFATSATEKMRITSAGNVGIGTTTPSNRFVVSNAGANGFEFNTTDNIVQTYNRATSLYTDFNLYSLNHRIFTGTSPTEKMRVDSNGNLLVGATSGSGARVSVTGAAAAGNFSSNNTSGDSTKYHFVVYENDTERGSITSNGSNTAYNTSSDVRLKENIADADDAASLIDAIQVRKFDWKDGGQHQRYGFVAQELIEVAPEAVSAPADEDAMMGVDYSKLVPMLVKEIQSLRARVAQLEGN